MPGVFHRESIHKPIVLVGETRVPRLRHYSYCYRYPAPLFEESYLSSRTGKGAPSSPARCPEHHLRKPRAEPETAAGGGEEPGRRHHQTNPFLDLAIPSNCSIPCLTSRSLPEEKLRSAAACRQRTQPDLGVFVVASPAGTTTPADRQRVVDSVSISNTGSGRSRAPAREALVAPQDGGT